MYNPSYSHPSTLKFLCGYVCCCHPGWYIVHPTIPTHAYQPSFFEKSEILKLKMYKTRIHQFQGLKKVFSRVQSPNNPSLPPSPLGRNCRSDNTTATYQQAMKKRKPNNIRLHGFQI
jgi:hypothetical protein